MAEHRMYESHAVGLTSNRKVVVSIQYQLNGLQTDYYALGVEHAEDLLELLEWAVEEASADA